MNLQLQTDERLELHRKFWSGEEHVRPIASFRIGDFFFSRHFRAAAPFLKKGVTVNPDKCNPEDFVDDYERMYSESVIIGQDAFWTAEPFTGFPWMEGILGCPVIGANEAFTTQPVCQTVTAALKHLQNTAFELQGTSADYWISGAGRSINPWLSLYLRFVTTLVAQSRARFPVGQPITRGLSDMFGALIGQMNFVLALHDNPEDSLNLIHQLKTVFLETMRLHDELVPPFHNGSCLGFYHCWAPGRSHWFQDDLSALLSPDLYRTLFIPSIRNICSAYPYNAVHLHSSSFFLLENFLDIEELRAIEVNKDVGGMSVTEMMPVLQKIQTRKSLIIWGDLTSEDLRSIEKDLDLKGLFLNIVTPDIRNAVALNEQIRNWPAGRES